LNPTDTNGKTPPPPPPPNKHKVAVTTGAILAGATDEDIKALDTYALDVGLAFQGMKHER
jgi:hypothetical protein